MYGNCWGDDAWKLYEYEESSVTTCDMCGCDIYEGDDYYAMYDVDVCNNCCIDYSRQHAMLATPDGNSVLVGDVETKEDRILVGHCEYCGHPIYAGDDYYDFDGDIVCENCNVDYMYESKTTAEREDF